MKRARRVLLAAGLLAVAILPLRAQSAAAPEVQLAAFATEPASPAFGEPFDLKLTLRIPRGSVVFLPDSLAATAELGPVGPGRWEERQGAEDMIEILAAYPLIAYQAGSLELPALELWIGPVEDSTGAVSRPDAPPHVRAAAPASNLAGTARHLIPVGGTSVAPYAPLQEDSVLRVARAPADVIGRNWSVWMFLAIGLVSAAGLGGIGTFGPRWWAGGGRALVARLRGRSPRQEALRELDRVRGLGWHRNGRLDDFYAATTGALRVFVSHATAEGGPGLTSSEVLAALGTDGRAASSDALHAAVDRAERVKFGHSRPDAETAEADWAAVRAWVAQVRES